jgi:hypothetical protein
MLTNQHIYHTLREIGLITKYDFNLEDLRMWNPISARMIRNWMSLNAT